MLLYCEPETRERVKAAVPELREVTFGLEAEGCKIVYYDGG